MDEREMKKQLEFFMIEAMLANLPDQLGRKPQDEFLRMIDIENPTEATKARLTRVIDRIYRSKYARIRR